MEALSYRHEVKHRISTVQAAELRQRLSVIMKSDDYTKPDGTYFIRSLYFDNKNDLALREKVDGAPEREKFRIRYYNEDLSFIRLEKKIKNRTLTAKQSARMTEAQVRRLLSGDRGVLLETGNPLCRELYIAMQLKGLEPKTVVDYDRMAFAAAPGNTRVTFDYHIRTGLWRTDFLNTGIPTFPTDSAEPDSVCILEVKYDAYLPDYIRDALQLGDCRSEPFSKYAACRRFG